MDALGRLFDIGLGVAPVDIDTANGATGKRIALSQFDGLTVVACIGAAASGTDDLTFTVKQHTAYISGTSNNLASATVASSTGLTYYYVKSETLLDNDEGWTKVTQSEAATFTLTGATYAATQKIVVIELHGAQLGDTYTHVSVDLGLTTSAVQLATILYFPHELRYPRKPAKLGNLLRPGIANA